LLLNPGHTSLPRNEHSISERRDTLSNAILPKLTSEYKALNDVPRINSIHKTKPLTQDYTPENGFSDNIVDSNHTDNKLLSEITPIPLLSSILQDGGSSQKPWTLNQIPAGIERSLQSPGITDQVQNVIYTGASDVVSFISNPLKWNTQDIINAALITSGTLVLLSLDKEINKNFNNGGIKSTNDIVKFGHFYGETNTTEYTVLGVAAVGIVFNDKKVMQLGLELYESYLIADNITGLLKYSIGRSRPYDEKGPYEFKMFDRPKRFCALPSGHSTLAFSMSTILASYTDNDYLKILIYTPAFITAFARIYENAHWASDVFLGAAIGHFVARFIVSRHNPFNSDFVQFAFDRQGRPGIQMNF